MSDPDEALTAAIDREEWRAADAAEPPPWPEVEPSDYEEPGERRRRR